MYSHNYNMSKKINSKYMIIHFSTDVNCLNPLILCFIKKYDVRLVKIYCAVAHYRSCLLYIKTLCLLSNVEQDRKGIMRYVIQLHPINNAECLIDIK